MRAWEGDGDRTARAHELGTSSRTMDEVVLDPKLAAFPRSLARLYGVMTGAIAAQLVLHAFTLYCETLARVDVLPTAQGGRTALGHAYLASFFVFALAIPVGCFAWMRWLDWSVKNLKAEGRPIERTPAQLVWAYFIPGANLYQPVADLKRIYRASGRFAPRPPVSISVWYGVSLVHLALMAFDLREGITVLTAVGSALGVLTQILALLVLRRFALVQPRSGATA